MAFIRKTSRAIGTSPTQINAYVVAAVSSSTIIGLSVANITASTVTVGVYHYDGANQTYIIKNAPIPPGSSLIVVGGDQKIVMVNGDSVYVVSDTASSVDVIMSVWEV